MSGELGSFGVSPVHAQTPGTRIHRAVIDIGAAGAPTVNGDSGITVTRTGTGAYSFTVPPIPDYTKTLPTLFVDILQSAVPTVAMATVLTYNPSTGAGTFKTALATPGTGVDPASGDQLVLILIAGTSGSR